MRVALVAFKSIMGAVFDYPDRRALPASPRRPQRCGEPVGFTAALDRLGDNGEFLCSVAIVSPHRSSGLESAVCIRERVCEGGAMEATPEKHAAGRRLPLLAADGARVPPTSARISLTDRCDLACVYCRPSRSDGYLERRLDEDAWQTSMRALVKAGVRRVRITGGEPLLHPQVARRVAFIASLGVDDLSLTTNATRLAELARPLRDAGLQRLTVSIDSLVTERFRRITRGGRLDRVLAGIEAALGAGYPELKTNTVVLRGDNDDELPD